MGMWGEMDVSLLKRETFNKCSLTFSFHPLLSAIHINHLPLYGWKWQHITFNLNVVCFLFKTILHWLCSPWDGFTHIHVNTHTPHTVGVGATSKCTEVKRWCRKCACFRSKWSKVAGSSLCSPTGIFSAFYDRETILSPIIALRIALKPPFDTL